MLALQFLRIMMEIFMNQKQELKVLILRQFKINYKELLLLINEISYMHQVIQMLNIKALKA